MLAAAGARRGEARVHGERLHLLHAAGRPARAGSAYVMCIEYCYANAVFTP